MLLGGASQFARRTAVGVQCPTAPVQEIVEVEKTACCSTKLVVRAPRPGDKDFKQCQCAEKKAACTTAAVSYEGFEIVAYLQSFESIKQWVLYWPSQTASPSQKSHYAYAPLAPPVPPPDCCLL